MNEILQNKIAVTAAAMAFSLEFLDTEDVYKTPMVETKPTAYFSHDRSDDDLDAAYQPQIDHMLTTDIICDSPIYIPDYEIPFDKAVVVIEQTDIVERFPSPQVSSSSSPRSSTPRPLTPPLLPPTERRSRPCRSPPRVRRIPQPTRCSSRVQIQILAREEAEKRKKLAREEAAKKRKLLAVKAKEKKKESKKYQKKIAQKVNIHANSASKQRKLVEQATKAAIRVFGNDEDHQKRGLPKTNTWKEWNIVSTNFLNKLKNEGDTVRRSHFHVYFVNSLNSIENALNFAKPRTDEMQEQFLRFIGDFHKIWDISHQYNGADLHANLGRLLERVIGRRISSSKTIGPTHLPWIQTRNVLEILLSLIARVETIYDLLNMLSKMQNNFISRVSMNTAENAEFKAYAITQLTGFSSILSRRLWHLTIHKKYNA